MCFRSFCTFSGRLRSGGHQAADVDPDTPVSQVAFPLEEQAELPLLPVRRATSTQDPNERMIFKRLEEQTNVHIDWTCFVADQFADKKKPGTGPVRKSSLTDFLMPA